MSPKATIIIGLCGSGKTYLADQRHSETGARVFEGIVEKKQEPEVSRWLASGSDCIVEEISYCLPWFRNDFIDMLRQEIPEAEIEWICLENDLESANWNVRHRTNKGEIEKHIKINARVAARYTYPDGCRPLAIKRIGC
jgi:hypothetical protein